MSKRRSFSLIAAVLLIGLAVGCGQTPPPEPPTARTEAKVDTVFGHVLTDNYFWLRERDNPDVIAYLEAENAYTDAMMKHAEGLEDKIFEELKGRIVEDDESVPARKGDYYYYYRTEKDKQYNIYCRKKGSLNAPEEVILDCNKLAEGKDYFNLGSYGISPDAKIMAYTIDTSGSERYIIRFKNLETGDDYADNISNAATSIAWANDNKTLFYMTRDAAWRPYRLYRHVLGHAQADDKLIYEEKDERFWSGIGRSKSGKYIIMGTESELTSEYRYLDADNPTGEFKVFQPRTTGIEYSIANHGDDFYILTNADSAVNFKLMVAPANRTGLKNWKTVVPPSDSVMIDGMEIFKDYLVLFIRNMGQTMIRVTDLRDNSTHLVKFDESVYTVENGTNLEYDSDILRFDYTSMLTPQSVYDYDMSTHEKVLRKQKEVPGYDRSKYAQKRVFAKASDGTMIPISMCYPKEMKMDSSNYCYLYGYGSYGLSYDPYFSTNRISLLDRGFIFAIAHVRGGGVMGRKWYEDGKFLKKKNTFTDFIDCAQYLISNGYTSSDKLAISGGSAGGMLIGAVLNMRPDLCKVAVANVPFVDVVNTMLDETLPLTVPEYEEWGNPNDSVYFEYMLSYSPYNNVKRTDYPNILITGGLNDPRVQYWEPAKWTAKLRAMKTDNNRLLLYTNMGAGHGGASGRYDALRELALEYAFVLDVFGIKK